MRRAVIFSGGYAHPFAQTSALLAATLGEHGFATTVSEDLDAALAKLDSETLFAVNALRWTMSQHDKYAPFRAEHAGTLGPQRLAAIERHVTDGGALLALHTAVICWDDQPGWRELLGGGWDWSRSHHPPLGPVEVAVTPPAEAVGLAESRFTLVDEAYHGLDPAPDCTIWAHVAAGGEAQPAAWTRRHGAGRVAVDALGHDSRSLASPGHRALLGAMLDWLGRDDHG